MATSSILRVDNLCCGMEAKMIRDIFSPMTDVGDVKISVQDRRISVEHNSSIAPSVLVMKLNEKHLGASLQEQQAVRQHGSHLTVREWLLATTVFLQAVLFASALGLRFGLKLHQAGNWASMCCIALSVPLAHDALLAIRRCRPNVELLMGIAMLGAAIQGELIEAASVGTIVSVMDFVKANAMEAVERRLSRMITDAPPVVTMAGGKSKRVRDLIPGDVYLVRAGDRVSADGVVISGKAVVDESQVNGEAMPQEKKGASLVYGGSMCQSGFLKVKADKSAELSFDGQISRMVKEAKTTLSESEALVGQFAVYYTPAVLLVAAAAALFQMQLQPFLVIVVAGCPCALLGAAPLAQGVTISVLASRYKLLVKRATTLESLGRSAIICLDKTGTLTKGKFELKHFESISGADRDQVLRLVAAVESRDNHPIAQALVQSFTGCLGEFEAASVSLPEVTDFKRHGRDGLTGSVGEVVVAVGNRDFVLRQGIPLLAAVESCAEQYAEKGTVIFVAIDEEVTAFLVLADAVREDSHRVISQFKSLGLRPLLLTGDRGHSAEQVAEATGISATDVYKGMLPADKARKVLELSGADDTDAELSQKGTGPDIERGMRRGLLQAMPTRGKLEVAFVGDGLNDCPALASAHVGIVIQELGAQATIDAASAVLQGSLSSLPPAIVIARRCQQLVGANIALACALNAAVIVLASLNLIPLWFSVLMDSVGMMLVLLNSLWPLMWHP